MIKLHLNTFVKVLFLLGGIILLAPQNAPFASEAERLENLNKQIEEYTTRIGELQSEANTLSNQVEQYNAKIRLTELKIDQTQEKVLLLGGRIDQLGESLGSLSNAFKSRVVETYKIARLGGDTSLMLLSGEDVNKTISRYYYLQKIQEADHKLLDKLQKAQDSYVDQKTTLEALEVELESQNKVLGSQKSAKANLLQVTRNDEKRYQDLLAKARAEFDAIQAIIAGRGDETEVGHVNKGERIASIIPGASCNSNGPHVHFIVSQNGNTQNPFSHLKPADHQNCSGAGECSAADPFNPSGSWDWPISPTIKFTQGYGVTWAVNNKPWLRDIYSFHNGIDINSLSGSEVRAVESGQLYQGSFGVGCRLRYVRVDHDDSDIETFYLHINY